MEQEFDFENRLLSTEEISSDSEAENSLRPKTLED